MNLSGISKSLYNQGAYRRLAQNMSSSNPYGIPSDYPLPPEAYGPHGPPAGYGTYTGPTGGAQVPYGGLDYGDLPPAAQGVHSGPAYSSNDYPGLDLSGEPTVVVNGGPRDPGFTLAFNPQGDPSWISPYPPQPSEPSPTPSPVPGQPVPDPGQGMPVQYGYGYTDPRSANAFIAGLVNWNGPGQANPGGGEMWGQTADAFRNRRSGAAGVNPVRQQ